MNLDTFKFNDQNVKEFLAETLPEGYYLNTEGVTRRNPEKESLGLDYKLVERITQYIPYLFQKHHNKKYWNVNSYRGKHNMEDYFKFKYERSYYITNGEFILAMLLLGYEYKKTNQQMFRLQLPNLTFNCSYRDRTPKLCECGIEYAAASGFQHRQTRVHKNIMLHIEPNNHINDTESEFQDYLEDAISRMVSNPVNTI